MAEIRTAETSIKARNGQDYPIGVLGLVLRGFAHERGIIPNKINYSVNVAVEPTASVLIYKRGKLVPIRPEVRFALPLLFRGGFFAVGNTAPNKESATGKVNSFLWLSVKNIAICIVKEIPTGKDGQYSRHTLEIGQGGIG